MGRPPKVTEDIVGILEQAFKDGANISQACILAKISRDSYYYNLENNPGFSDRMHAAQEWISIIARRNLAQQIAKGNPVVSLTWLERKDKKEFAPRQELSGPEGQPLGYVYEGDLLEGGEKDAIQISEAEEIPVLPEASPGKEMGKEVRE